MSPWKKLGNLAPSGLGGARVELHWAAQLPALGVGRALVEPRDDSSHTALTWRRGCWFSEPVPGPVNLRAGLRAEDLTLILERDGEVVRSCSLFGQTLVEGLRWLRNRVEELGGPKVEGRIELRSKLPEHPIGRGANFRAELGPGLAELSRWFGNASYLLEKLGPDASPIRTWPHHFDMATLLPAGGQTAGSPQTVGVGLSSADDHFPEPYFYVSPWPPPDPTGLPALPRGGWQVEGFFGAVLTATELLAESDQEEAAREFCDAAITASRQLLAP